MRRMAGEESGQALIMVVSLLMVLALVAGLFVAMVSARLAQSARQSDLIVLQQIAEAGLRFADDALTNGAEGADWRPDLGNPTASRTYDYGAGRFTLTVNYQPDTAEDPYWNCIKIDSTAELYSDREGGYLNPFLRRRVVGYKRVLLPDYLRFVTNKDRSSAPAELGVPLQVQDELYQLVLEGPLRVNGDLTWYGRNRLALWTGSGPRRDDQAEVAGVIRHSPDPDFPASVRVSYGGGAEQDAQPSEPPPPAQFTTLPAGGKPRYIDGLQTVDATGQQRWARYLEPPRLSRQRYLRLTRDSGEWKTSPDGLRRFNTGWYGWGEGIYISNAVHLQSHSYEVMRNNWLGKDTRWWDSPRNRAYIPPAVRIVLHGGDVLPSGVELYWPNPAPGEGWQADNGDPLGSSTLTLPYPANGVIYAEGNVSVSGAVPNGQSITIVSEGTIYIDGPIRDASNAKVALLARDSVVLNTTVMAGYLYPVESHLVVPAAYSGDLPTPYEIAPGQAFEGRLYSHTGGNITLYLIHSGAANELLPPGPEGQTKLQLLVNGTAYDWDPGTLDPDPYYLFKEPPAASAANESNAVAPLFEGMPHGSPAVPPMTIGLTAGWNSLRFETPSDTINNYWLYQAGLQGLDVEVDALVYAETGSWFVIPGEFFTPEGLAADIAASPNGVVRSSNVVTVTTQQPHGYMTGDRVTLSGVTSNGGSAFNGTVVIEGVPSATSFTYSQPGPNTSGGGGHVVLAGFPGPEEPLDVKITIKGAICENRTADVSDVARWTSRWRGADQYWIPGSGTSSRGLEYEYDPGLRAAVGGRLVLPRLPVSPALFGWKQEL